MRFLVAATVALLASAPTTAANYIRTALVPLPEAPVGEEVFGGVFDLDQPLNGLVAGDTVELNIVFSRAINLGPAPKWLVDDFGFLPAGFTSLNQDIYDSVTYELGNPTGDVIASGSWDGVERSIDKTAFFKIADPATFRGGGFSSWKLTYSISASPAKPITFAYAGVTEEVAVDPIPEPATWAMMIGGFGMAGAALRRRSGQPLLQG